MEETFLHQPYHIPALLYPTIEGLDIKKAGIYADATFGGGGHSRAILKELGPQGHLYGFDRDIDARANAIDDPRFTFVHSDFRYMPNFLRFYSAMPIDGVVADLGVSFHHFDDASRGFSFRADAPLDMRMNQGGALTAAHIVNNYDERELARIFSLYGDIKRPMPLVRAIIDARHASPVDTTGRLFEIVSPFVSPRQEKKDLARIFQALRIEVNDETSSLRALLENLPRILRPGGRAAIITYHSLEDRLVKNFFRAGNAQGNAEKDFFGRVNSPWRLITRSPIVADEQEVERNPRSRSAKLRVAELIESTQ